MDRLPTLFIGIFLTIFFSWGGIVWYSSYQQRELLPFVDAASGELKPAQEYGMIELGKQEYIKHGCIYCHSQQVRRKGWGADYERGWGERQSMPIDYILQDRVVLGTMRTGPDLMTVGSRLPSEAWHHLHLYNPQITSPGSNMPPFAFLYEKKKIVNGKPAKNALNLTGEYAVEAGYQIVPTRRADALVAYLLSLQLDYDLPASPPEEKDTPE